MHGSPKVQQLVGGGIARQEARWLQSQLGLDDVPDACGRNAFHELAGAAAQRYRSVGGRGWMPFSPDWAGVAKPRVADSAGRPLHVGGYRTARGRHASPHGLDGAVPLHVFRRGQAPVPRATAVGCGRALPYLLGEVHRIRRYRWRRVGLWVPCCFCRLQLHGVADLRVSAEHWAIGFPGLRAQGTRGVNTGVLPAGCCRPCPRARSGACASGFWMLRAALLCDGGPAADCLLCQMRWQWRGPIPPAMESRMGTAGDSMPGPLP
ncbi:hypothetical protein ECC02_012088 [Trypanosoma cruzi]|uniref:Uncharacterized protein n=1 Tax=Trypanosoma cruzi TaxID=5693 RepID=A0A7J6XL34_TRYCR|nr:hypothetical protein ECC02_012088 [Trypanosoma cruzi]